MGNVYIHETGHSLGWEGHYTGTNNIMCPNPSTIVNFSTQYYTPSSNDTTHLRNIYNLL